MAPAAGESHASISRSLNVGKSTRRAIVIDIEPPAHWPEHGGRLYELSCLELLDFRPSGRAFQSFFKSDYELSEIIRHVTGLSKDYLDQMPTFADQCDVFLEFLGEDAFLIGNGIEFTVRVINWELSLLDKPAISVADTFDVNAELKERFSEIAQYKDRIAHLGVNVSSKLEKSTLHHIWLTYTKLMNGT